LLEGNKENDQHLTEDYQKHSCIFLSASQIPFTLVLNPHMY